MRVIDGDALKAWFFRPYSNEEAYSNIEVRTVIDSQPTIDAVPVIRCNDCIFSDVYSARDGRLLVYCCNHGCFGFAPNDYCSRGKKKTE